MALVLTGVLVFAGAYAIDSARDVPDTSGLSSYVAPLNPLQLAAAPTIVFIGDSYTAGTSQGGIGAANYTQRVAQAAQWQVADRAIGGIGYVNSNTAGQTFASQLPTVARLKPQVVVIAGSRNDAGEPAGQLRGAATDLYGQVQTAAPQARVVVIGPIWSDANPPPAILAARDTVRAAAQDAGLAFIDPIAEGWFAQPGLIGADGIHPTDEGHRYLADMVRANLVRLGALPVS